MRERHLIVTDSTFGQDPIDVLHGLFDAARRPPRLFLPALGAIER
jgi:hypothetical protein